MTSRRSELAGRVPGPSGSMDPSGAAGAAPDTRNRLLDAAEELFAQGGIDATSLRAVTRAAGANLAAVNYHFGSKRALIVEVFARRLGPLNEERLACLDAVVERAGTEILPVEEVLDAFTLPALRLREECPGGSALVRLIARAFSEPSEEVRTMVFAQFDQVFRRFHGALVRSLPDLSPDDVAARFRYVVGAMVFAMAHPRPPGMASGDHVDDRAHLVPFLAAGLRAPVPPVAPSSPGAKS